MSIDMTNYEWCTDYEWCVDVDITDHEDILDIVCVCVPGKEYGSEHVQRLAEMVFDNTHQLFKFTAITASRWPGWWAKIELFKPGRFSGRVLYFDLDVDVVGPIDDLLDSEAPFVTALDWERRGANSSVMLWNAGEFDYLYTEFDESVISRLGRDLPWAAGDQDWINERVSDINYFRLGHVVSYKHTVLRRGGVPPGAKVVAYHGQPKPWNVVGY